MKASAPLLTLEEFRGILHFDLSHYCWHQFQVDDEIPPFWTGNADSETMWSPGTGLSDLISITSMLVGSKREILQ